LKNTVARFVGTVAFLGYSPVAPGTVGTLAAAAVYWFLVPARFWPATWWSLAIAVIVGAAGVWAGGICETLFGKKDPGKVCVDEFAAYFLAIAFLPKAPLYAVAAFFLFRLFDIVKPFPANRSQRLGGGWGIMADDYIAAVYTNLVLQGARAIALSLGWWPRLFV